jgi:D-serine deaminase-like pyridoxal phosphate-dependent protein
MARYMLGAHFTDVHRHVHLAMQPRKSGHVVMKPDSPTTTELRPGVRVFHDEREATVLAVDEDPAAHVWIVFVDNPDEDAMVHRSELAQPCAVCERA